MILTAPTSCSTATISPAARELLLAQALASGQERYPDVPVTRVVIAARLAVVEATFEPLPVEGVRPDMTMG